MYPPNNDATIEALRSTGISGISARSAVGSLRIKTIQDGDEGIRETVRNMIRLTNRDKNDPRVVAIAKSLVMPDPVETIRACFDYVVANIEYKDDSKEAMKAGKKHKDADVITAAREGTEFLIAPKYTLTGDWPYGDCDDMSMATAALLMSPPIGYQCWFRILAWKGQEFTHVNLICDVPGEDWRMSLDPVMGPSGFGNEKRPTNRQEFFQV